MEGRGDAGGMLRTLGDLGLPGSRLQLLGLCCGRPGSGRSSRPWTVLVRGLLWPLCTNKLCQPVSVSTCSKTGVDFLTVSLEILDNACIINMCTVSYHQYRIKFLNDFS